jgi:glutathione S-transferase
MIKLYGHPFSRAHRVLWMLKEQNLPFEHEPIDFRNRGTHTPEYLRINPNGRVPALVDGSLVLFESLAINLYLARQYGGDVAPQSTAEDAMATQWSFWGANEIEHTLLFTAANLWLFPLADRRPEQAAQGLRKLHRPFSVIDAHLAMQPFLLGERFSVADLNVSAILSLAALASVDLSAYPALKAWLDKCLERPAAADWKPINFVVPRPSDEVLLTMFL